ncbi:MAG TPA: siderophore-interacting protein [Actinophytocola sp.]|nr:siderophore-interacting protein [Actinophytocola sp.]
MTAAFERVWHPVALRELEVLRVAAVTPLMLRVTVGGDQLGAFRSGGRELGAFRTAGFDDHVKLFLPAPGQREPVLPAQADGHLDWPEHGPRPVHRDYTVRRFDAAAGELDLDVVVHPGGVAAGWAAAATGSRIHLAGPKMSHRVPEASRYLLVGDETALPAIARFADEAPPGTAVHAVVEIADGGERQELPVPVIWVHRDAGSALLPVLRTLELPVEGTVAWVAGEAGTVRRVRLHLARERGIAVVHATGYWRRGVTGDRPDEPPARIRELADLLTPTAVRLAVTLNIPELLAGGPRTAVELAGRCGTDPRATLALLRLLAARGIVTATGPSTFALADLGEVLLDEGPRHHLDLAGAGALLDQSWDGLPHAVRTGRAAFPQLHGHGFWEHLDADEALAASFDAYLDRWAAEWMPPAAAALGALGASSIVDVGGGSGGLLAMLLRRDPGLHATLFEQPASAARARDRLAGFAQRCRVVEGSFFDPLPPGGGLYVLAQVLHDWPDEQAAAILRRSAEAAGPDGRVVLVERVLDAAAPQPDHVVSDLRMLVLFGARERTVEEFAALAGHSGLRVARIAPAGPMLSLVELVSDEADPKMHR